MDCLAIELSTEVPAIFYNDCWVVKNIIGLKLAFSCHLSCLWTTSTLPMDLSSQTNSLIISLFIELLFQQQVFMGTYSLLGIFLDREGSVVKYTDLDIVIQGKKTYSLILRPSCLNRNKKFGRESIKTWIGILRNWQDNDLLYLRRSPEDEVIGL